MVALPVPIAVLPAPKAMVKVVPPLFFNCPRLSCAEVTVVEPFMVPEVIILSEELVGCVPVKSTPLVLSARMEL